MDDDRWEEWVEDCEFDECFQAEVLGAHGAYLLETQADDGRLEAPTGLDARLRKIQGAARSLADALPEPGHPMFMPLTHEFHMRAQEGSAVESPSDHRFLRRYAPDELAADDPVFRRDYSMPPREVYRLALEAAWLADAVSRLRQSMPVLPEKEGGRPRNDARPDVRLVQKIASIINRDDHVQLMRRVASDRNCDAKTARVQILQEVLAVFEIPRDRAIDQTINEHA